MILFKKDWSDYPTAIPDYNTTNESFIRYTELLKSMGVENHLWPLQLFQPELSGVDVYDENLSTEIKEKIAIECEYNLFYYLREVARIPPTAGLDPVQFKANRGNMALMWSFLNHIDFMLIQIRQTGKSVSTDTLSSWLQAFAMRNSRQLLITKDDTLRRENVIRLRNMRGFLPKWLVYDDPTDAANQSVMTYNLRKNIYRTAVGQNSEDRALNVGRGASVAILHCDEGPFTSFIDITLPAALASGNAAKDEAKLNGLPYGNIFTTTAGKIDSRSGGYMYGYYANGTSWTEALLDLLDHDDLVLAIDNQTRASDKKRSKRLIVGEFDHLQLGYTDEWLYDKLRSTGAEGEEADRDFFNRWTSGGISSPLPVEVLEAIKHSERSPEFSDISKQRYVTRWYVPKSKVNEYNEGRPVIVGVDTSDAIGNDAISITYTDAYTLKVVGRADINETSLITAANFVADALVDIKGAVMVIEKKSSAQTFIDTAIIKLVAAGLDPFKKIFNRIVDLMNENRSLFDEVNKVPLSRRTPEWYDKYRKYFGFNTTGRSRDLLYSSVLSAAAERSASNVADKILSGQLRSLVVKAGRIDHANGNHDDAVISWLLTHWLLMYGKHLNYYDIDVDKIVVRAGSNGAMASQEELDALDRQQEIKEEIELLAEQLNSTDSRHIVHVIECKLAVLNSKIEDLGGEAINIDAIMNEAKRERQEKLKRNRERLKKRPVRYFSR